MVVVQLYYFILGEGARRLLQELLQQRAKIMMFDKNSPEEYVK
jgi:hypothetical protein